MIPALVLTAGLATRLRPLSFVRAKAALPVAGEALARRVLRQLADAGIRDAVLNLHHLPESLTTLIGDGSDMGLRVRYSWEGAQVLGRAGGPRHALDLLGASRFLILNGDTLSNVDVGEVIEQHAATRAKVTLAVVPNREPDKYSGLAVTADRVTGFVPRGSSQPSFHFYGVQVVESQVFASLPDNTPAETIPDLYGELICRDADSVRAYASEAEYFDIGTPADYLVTSQTIAGREGSSLHGSGIRIAPHAQVDSSVLWDDVTVGAGAVLRNCVVTDGVHVPEDTAWHGVVLRLPEGELTTGERRIGALAISAL